MTTLLDTPDHLHDPNSDNEDPWAAQYRELLHLRGTLATHLDHASVEITGARRVLDRLTGSEVGDSELADTPAAGDIRALLTTAARDLRAALATLRTVPE